MHTVIPIPIAQFLLLFGLVFSLSVQAQEPHLGVLVGNLDQDAETCGFQSSSIESVATLTLRDNGIRPTRYRTDPFLYLKVTAINTASGGVFSADVSVVSTSQPSEVSIGGFQSRKGLVLILCDKGSLNATARHNAASALSETIEVQIKDCLGNLHY